MHVLTFMILNFSSFFNWQTVTWHYVLCPISAQKPVALQLQLEPVCFWPTLWNFQSPLSPFSLCNCCCLFLGIISYHIFLYCNFKFISSFIHFTMLTLLPSFFALLAFFGLDSYRQPQKHNFISLAHFNVVLAADSWHHLLFSCCLLSAAIGPSWVVVFPWLYFFRIIENFGNEIVCWHLGPSSMMLSLFFASLLGWMLLAKRVSLA